MRIAAWMILTLAYGAATSQQPSSALPPAPFHFDGKWLCDGAMGNGRSHQSSFQGTTVLKGTWIRLEEADIAPTTGYVAEYLIGWDASSKKVVEFDANNFSAANYSSDEGWKNNTLVLRSSVATDPKVPYVQNRFSFHIDKQDAFTMEWQVRRTADGEWKTADHLACSRTSNSER